MTRKKINTQGRRGPEQLYPRSFPLCLFDAARDEAALADEPDADLGKAGGPEEALELGLVEEAEGGPAPVVHLWPRRRGQRGPAAAKVIGGPRDEVVYMKGGGGMVVVVAPRARRDTPCAQGNTDTHEETRAHTDPPRPRARPRPRPGPRTSSRAQT